MAQHYILSIDAGTTSVKTVLFDIHGSEVASRVNEYELEKPKPDYIEVDPEEYWQATLQGISEIIEETKVNAEEIHAVGVTSQGETLITLDDNGKPLRKAIVWLDNRSHQEAEHIAQRFDRKRVYEITGQQEIVPTWTATKILWLKKHEPECFNQTAKFLLVEDYLIYRLTGKYATAHSLCPSTLYYDLHQRDWWHEMLDFMEIKTCQLPKLQAAGETVGKVTAEINLSRNTIVTTAPIDQIAATIGSGNIKPGIVTETTGSALAICASLAKPILDPEMKIGLYSHAVSDQFILMPWVPTAGMVLRWFRDEFCPELSYKSMSDLAESIPIASDDLLMLPHLSGAFCPEVNPAARGVFYGMTMAHTKGHFIRAILEAVAFMLKDCIEMLENLGLDCQNIYSLGGGSRDPLWLQMKADVLNKTVSVPKCSEATCLGTAILAAHKSGLYPSLENAVENMVHFKGEYRPIAQNVKSYAHVYEKYQALNKTLLPTWSGNSERTK